MNVSLDVESVALKFNAEVLASKSVKVSATEQRTLKFTIHCVDLTVQAKARFNRQYLRFVAGHVTSFNGAAGGRIGLDDHSDQSLRPDVCGEKLSLQPQPKKNNAWLQLSRGRIMQLSRGRNMLLNRGRIMQLSRGRIMQVSRGRMLQLSRGRIMQVSLQACIKGAWGRFTGRGMAGLFDRLSRRAARPR